MKAALAEGAARGEGEDLDALLGAVLDSIRREEPRDDDEFVSLTL